jgi:hypothetical protein
MLVVGFHLLNWKFCYNSPLELVLDVANKCNCLSWSCSTIGEKTTDAPSKLLNVESS